MALALPLLVAAALSVVTVQRFLNGPQGFNPDGLLTMRLQLPDARYATRRQPGAVRRRRRRASARDCPASKPPPPINVMPAVGQQLGPFDRDRGHTRTPIPSNPPVVDYRAATPDIFAALQTPIRSRARPSPTPIARTPQPVVIVSESLARSYWPNEDPIGKRMRIGTTSRG